MRTFIFAVVLSVVSNSVWAAVSHVDAPVDKVAATHFMDAPMVLLTLSGGTGDCANALIFISFGSAPGLDVAGRRSSVDRALSILLAAKATGSTVDIEGPACTNIDKITIN
ncbi:Uncharacterised protein [Halioglobus japonicus]|nr:Uncharacterised protein [Halioglobus japonicus]